MHRAKLQKRFEPSYCWLIGRTCSGLAAGPQKAERADGLICAAPGLSGPGRAGPGHRLSWHRIESWDASSFEPLDALVLINHITEEAWTPKKNHGCFSLSINFLKKYVYFRYSKSNESFEYREKWHRLSKWHKKRFFFWSVKAIQVAKALKVA